MKKINLIITGIFFSGFLFSQTTTIPDPNFEQALISLGIDTDGLNGSVATANISGVTTLSFYNNGISDLTGIEGFTSLEELACRANPITTIDLSQNTALQVFICSNSQLTSLDLSNNAALTQLECPYSQLESINVSENSNLTLLSVYNNQLTSLDLSNNTALTRLDCYNNQLVNLDLAQNTALTMLLCQNNQLTSLDLTQNIVLSRIYCQSNQLTSVDIRNGYNSSMYYLDFTLNPSLTCIQIDDETKVYSGNYPYSTWKKDATANYLEDCSRVTYVPDDNFEQALIDLGLDNDGIVNDIVETAGIYSLITLSIENKNIIDLTGIEDFALLETLNCSNNPINTFDIGANTLLKELNCSFNELTSLDISQNIALKELICSNNQLNNLDVSKNTSLTKIDCSYNTLTNLNLNKNTSLTEINCNNNQITRLAVYNSNNSIITIFNAINNPELQCISVNNETDANNGIAPYDSWQKDNTATYSEGCLDVGYTFIPDNNFEQALIDYDIDTDGTINNSVETVNISGLTTLNVEGKGIFDLKGIEDFTSLTYLKCSSNPIKTINLSQNVALTTLLCYYTSLTSLDLSQNTALTELRCYHTNSLTSLDLSNNTALKILDCYSGQLTSLDLSQNTALTYLNCYFNKLTSLNVKNGNNSLFGIFSASANYDLECIQVDNETDANNGVAPYNKWSVDATVTFSEDCSFSGITYVPDDNFELALIELGIDKDGVVNDGVAIADIYQITSLNIASKNITDLTGIEDFKSLKILYCQSNQLSNLDLSSNITLTELNCSANLLTGLNVNNNNNDILITFNATSNSNLQCIKVDNETDANNGSFPYSFWQKDVTANYSEACLGAGFTYIPDNNFEQALINLGIDKDGIINNSVATSDISDVVTLNVSSKSINSLKGIEDFNSLTTLSCQSNTIVDLDLSQNTALVYLDCNGNKLTSLNVSQNIALEYLDCHSNKLTSLNVSQNTALTELDCRTNLLTILNVNNNTELFKLTCSQNKLTSLNVSNNTDLLGLFCYSNLLTSLDVSKNVVLEGLYCDQNQISSLNLNGASALELLICGNNQLTDLDVSQNIALTRLDCYFNNLFYLDMSQNKALNNLDCERNQLLFLNVKNGKNSLLTIFNAKNNPTLQCILVDNAVAANAAQSPYTNWNKDVTASYSETCGISNDINVTLDFNSGWNIMSFMVVPDDIILKNMLQSLIDQGILEKVMDESGNVIEDYGSSNGGWQDHIGNMMNTEGYKINVNSESTLEVNGIPVQLPYDIPLSEGWNIISWPSPNEQDGEEVFQTLISEGKLIKVMDEAGYVIEDYGASNGGWQNFIGNFKPGEGYKVNVTTDCILTINENGTKSEKIIQKLIPSAHFIPAFEGNGTDHMNINLLNLAGSGIMEGDEIGVFDGEICVGSARISNLYPSFTSRYSSVSIPVSAADGLYRKNGYTDGNPVAVKMYRNGIEYPVLLKPLNDSKIIFEKGSSLFAQLDVSTGTDEMLKGGITEIKCYPNPFSEEVNIEIILAEDSEVLIEIQNQLGQRVKTIINKNRLISGNHLLKWNGKGENDQAISPGIYHIQIVVNDVIYHRKIVLAK